MGIPDLSGINEKCSVAFYTTLLSFLIKGGLMEPNGILCEVQPGQ